MENYANWFPDVYRVEATDKAIKNSVGKSYVEKLKLNGVSTDLLIKVVRYEKNKLFITHGDLAPILPMMKMEFTEQGDDVLFELSYFSRNVDLSSETNLINTLSTDIQQRAIKSIEQLKQIISNN